MRQLHHFLIFCCFKLLCASNSFLHATIEDDVETEISDWSNAKKDEIIRTINFIIGIDSSLTRFYNYEENKIKSATITLIHTVNQYFFPLNIRLAIVDILPVKGIDMGLDDFLSWKKEQKSFVDHDVTVLLRHNYEGGIAFQDGMCTNNSVVISGFFPESTMKNAWVFIHQLAHVIGLTHKITTRCECEKGEALKCLKLRGFPVCSVQELVKKLAGKKCLLKKDESNKIPALSICGNGLIDIDEECDCGPEKFCDNVLCDATRCKFIMKKSWLLFSITLIFALGSFIFLLLIWKCFILRITQSILRKFSSFSNNQNIEEENQKRTLNPKSNSELETAVKMRAPIENEARDQTERRWTRFSDIYIQMRPISRFWEKFHQPAASFPAAEI